MGWKSFRPEEILTSLRTHKGGANGLLLQQTFLSPRCLQILCLSLSLFLKHSLSHSRTPTHSHAPTHMHTHTHLSLSFLSPLFVPVTFFCSANSVAPKKESGKNFGFTFSGFLLNFNYTSLSQLMILSLRNLHSILYEA